MYCNECDDPTLTWSVDYCNCWPLIPCQVVQIVSYKHFKVQNLNSWPNQVGCAEKHTSAIEGWNVWGVQCRLKPPRGAQWSSLSSNLGWGRKCCTSQENCSRCTSYNTPEQHCGKNCTVSASRLKHLQSAWKTFSQLEKQQNTKVLRGRDWAAQVRKGCCT